MTPEAPDPSVPLADDADLGPPVVELRDLAVGVDDRFGDRVRGKIERRLLAGELLTLTLSAPLTVLLEFLRLAFDMFAGKRRT